MDSQWWGPAWYDWALAASEARGLAARRRRLLASARGKVLEVGAGTGLNLRHYRPERVCSVQALEPDAARRRRLEVRAVTLPVELDVGAEPVEAAVFPDSSFDTVVSTLVLCCLPDPVAGLAAIARWLVPGGRFLFLEPAPGPRRQLATSSAGRLLSPVRGGCRFDRDTVELVRSAGLPVTDCDRFTLPAGGLRPVPCVAAVAWRRPIGEPDPALSVLAGAGAGSPEAVRAVGR